MRPSAPLCTVTNPPLCCDPTVLIDDIHCLCEGGWGIYCGGFVICVLGLLSLSQAFEVVGHVFVLLTNIGRQRLRRLRPHFQVSNGCFNYIYYFLFNRISDFCTLFEVLWLDWQKPVVFVIVLDLFRCLSY